MRTLGGFSDAVFQKELSESLTSEAPAADTDDQPDLIQMAVVANSGANAAPFFTEPAVFTVEEDNADVSFTVQAFDPDGDAITFSISGGEDSGDFQIDPATGEITFLVTPDFQAPADADTDNSYQVEITASDGTDSATLAIEVHVTEAEPDPVDLEILRPGGGDPFSPVVGFITPFSGGTLMDLAVNDDAGQASGTTFSLVGEDAFQFRIDAATGVLSIDETTFLGGDGVPNSDFSDLSFDGDALFEIVVLAEHVSGTNDTMAVDFFLFIGG